MLMQITTLASVQGESIEATSGKAVIPEIRRRGDHGFQVY